MPTITAMLCVQLIITHDQGTLEVQDMKL